MLLTFVLAAALAAGTDARTATSADPGACLDVMRVRNWVRIDDFTMLVDAGRSRYRINLLEPCPAVGGDFQARFFGNSGNRVCGRPNESVEVGGRRCGISKVVPISKETYDALLHGDKRD